MYSIGIDLGGTNIAVAVVSEKGEILSKVSKPTPKELGADLPQKVAKAMAKTTILALEEGKFTLEDANSIGVGAPGTINPETQTIGYWSNLDFCDVPLGTLLLEAFQEYAQKVPKIYLENDANAAALGEFYAGAGKNGASLVAITLGTGVGGGAIYHDKLFTGFNYAGMEVGHFVLKAGGLPCSCGRLGCFEAYSSATALINQTKSAMEQNTSSKLWEVVHQDLNKVNGKTVFDAMELGDETAKKVFNHYVFYLANGITSMINLFQPEILCIGGGIAGQKDTLLQPLLDIINQEDYARNLSSRCKVTLAELGNDAGIIGAAFLYR